RVGVLGEDVEDHRGAVGRGAAEDLLEVAALRGRQVVVEDDGVGVDRVGDVAQLLGLALAHVRRRIGAVAALQDALDLVRARSVDELAELVEVGLLLVRRRRRDRHPHEHDALAEAPVDQRHARSSTSIVATWSAGPVRMIWSPSRSTTRSPPGWWTVTRSPTNPHS